MFFLFLWISFSGFNKIKGIEGYFKKKYHYPSRNYCEIHDAISFCLVVLFLFSLNYERDMVIEDCPRRPWSQNRAVQILMSKIAMQLWQNLLLQNKNGFVDKTIHFISCM